MEEDTITCCNRRGGQTLRVQHYVIYAVIQCDTAIPQRGSETARIHLLRVEKFDSLTEDFPAPTMYFWIGFGLDPMSPKLIVYFSYKTLLKISHYCIISSNIKDTDFIVPVLIADDNRTEINQYGGLSGRVMSLSGYLRTNHILENLF